MMIFPYHKNCEKLLSLAAAREEEYSKWGKIFNKVYVDVKDKTDVVSNEWNQISQKSQFTTKRIELYDQEKSDLNHQLTEISFAVKELTAKDRVLEEYISQNEKSIAEGEKKFEQK